jgi:hypothetical protein
MTASVALGLTLMPKFYKDLSLGEVPGVTPRVSKPHDYANHMFMRL